LADFLDSSLKQFRQMIRNLVGNNYGKAVSEEKIFRNRPIRKKELPVAAIFVNGSGRNEHSL
jgi:hypothetical protein